MSKDETDFKVRYQIDDGYCGGARPQNMTFNADDLDPEMTDEQITDRLYEFVEEDMRRFTPAIDNTDEFVRWAREQIKAQAENQ